MHMSTLADEKESLELIPQVDEVADYFYMVDTFGGVYPKGVNDTIALVRSKIKVKLGFHGHNNLKMALVNTLGAIDEGIHILDAIVTGMGRGTANLKTELLLTVLNAKSYYAIWQSKPNILSC
jgi:4-hydroxy 2-oxovalerate aldolase